MAHARLLKNRRIEKRSRKIIITYKQNIFKENNIIQPIIIHKKILTIQFAYVQCYSTFFILNSF